MERLIAFGCSITYGHGLPDCFVAPDNSGPVPSKVSWPELVAKYMNKECVNVAVPGASNKHIWHKIINFKFKENDTVFILWTFPSRTSVIKHNTVVDIGAWNYQEYFNYVDFNDSVLMSKLYVSHANMVLASQNVKVYNLILERKDREILKLNETIKHIPIYIHLLEDMYPRALDNVHPGVECNEVFAKKILDFLKIENNLKLHKSLNVLRRFIRKRNDQKRQICK